MHTAGNYSWEWEGQQCAQTSQNGPSKPDRKQTTVLPRHAQGTRHKAPERGPYCQSALHYEATEAPQLNLFSDITSQPTYDPLVDVTWQIISNSVFQWEMCIPSYKAVNTGQWPESALFAGILTMPLLVWYQANYNQVFSVDRSLHEIKSFQIVSSIHS